MTSLIYRLKTQTIKYIYKHFENNNYIAVSVGILWSSDANSLS